MQLGRGFDNLFYPILGVLLSSHISLFRALTDKKTAPCNLESITSKEKANFDALCTGSSFNYGSTESRFKAPILYSWTLD